MTGVVGELNVVYKGRHRRHQMKYFCSSAPCTWDNLLWMAKKYLDFSLNPFLLFLTKEKESCILKKTRDIATFIILLQCYVKTDT